MADPPTLSDNYDIITFEDVQNNRRLLNVGRPVSLYWIDYGDDADYDIGGDDDDEDDDDDNDDDEEDDDKDTDGNDADVDWPAGVVALILLPHLEKKIRRKDYQLFIFKLINYIYLNFSIIYI